jgi:hypothetical protein
VGSDNNFARCANNPRLGGIGHPTFGPSCAQFRQSDGGAALAYVERRQDFPSRRRSGLFCMKIWKSLSLIAMTATAET